MYKGYFAVQLQYKRKHMVYFNVTVSVFEEYIHDHVVKTVAGSLGVTRGPACHTSLVKRTGNNRTHADSGIHIPLMAYYGFCYTIEEKGQMNTSSVSKPNVITDRNKFASRLINFTMALENCTWH